MTEPDAFPPESPAAPATAVAPDTCSVCPHPWDAHDALGVRFCTATMRSAQSRGCICRPS